MNIGTNGTCCSLEARENEANNTNKNAKCTGACDCIQPCECGEQCICASSE